MNFATGDRVRWEGTDHDGLPFVYYGFVGGQAAPGGPVVVMLDGDISGTVVPVAELRTVSLTTVELILHGADLLDDPALRRGLVALWQAEADNAGLAVEEIDAIDPCNCNGHAWSLARFWSCGERYVVSAFQRPDDPDLVRIRATPDH